VIFLKHLKFVENIGEDKLDDFYILHFGCLLDRFLDCIEETFFLMFSNGHREVIFDVLQFPVKLFELFNPGYRIG
jgi:hypothetical protein